MELGATTKCKQLVVIKQIDLKVKVFLMCLVD